MTERSSTGSATAKPSAGQLADAIEAKLGDPCGEYIISALEGSIIVPALRAPSVRLVERGDGYYGCSLPPGACHCPQLDRHKCHSAYWVAAEQPVATATLAKIADKAREWAAHYKPHSDGQNTFVLFAEWVERLAAEQPLATVEREAIIETLEIVIAIAERYAPKSMAASLEAIQEAKDAVAALAHQPRSEGSKT